MAASDPSKYEEILIESNDQKNSVDIRLGVQSFDYYEDIFSPTITAKVIVTETGNSVNGKGTYQGLPLRGGERVSVKIIANSPNNKDLDFSEKSKYLYVSSISNVLNTNQSETFTLNLCSREAITNETARIPIKFPTSSPISASAEKIIKTYLQTGKNVEVDQTMNKYGFIGNLRKPFTVLTWLASKGVPESEGKSTAGYVFYETQSGYKFKSLDKLISANSKATYIANDVVNDNKGVQDFTIVSFVIDKNQNLVEKLRLGAYSSMRSYFNPLSFSFTHPEKGVFNKSEHGGSELGNSGLILPSIGEGSDKTLADAPTRLFTGVLDLGTQEVGVSTERNAEALNYQSQALLRYNSLFTVTVSATLPLNTNLEAGNIIQCMFPEVSTKKEKEYDPDQSGLYMIKELRHHYDAEGSYTSVKLVRDTFGVYNPRNNEK
jgi:hypothetical protein